MYFLGRTNGNKKKGLSSEIDLSRIKIIHLKKVMELRLNLGQCVEGQMDKQKRMKKGDKL